MIARNLANRLIGNQHRAAAIMFAAVALFAMSAWPIAAQVSAIKAPEPSDFVASAPMNPTAPVDLSELEEQAIRAAAKHVAPSVLRLEILDATTSDASVASSARASAVVVNEEGWAVASAASFPDNATTILAQLPDGKRVAARRVSTDRTRQIVLLKLEGAGKLAVPDAAPLGEVAVGHWAIAIGRMFDPATPGAAAEVNLSVGVVSGLDRVWGKAIQTDAKISPNNYGGPLVDIRGRVMALVTPLPLDGAGGTEGGELYDSGIGFAVPWEQIVANFKKMSEGKDLKAGKLGIRLSSADAHAADVSIGAVSPGSPARAAGLRQGDRIVAIDGAAIERPSQLSRQIQPKYAGDRIHLVVERTAPSGAKADANASAKPSDKPKTERIERDITLVADLPPYRRAMLGVLPRRDESATIVRFVWPDSPASRAGLQAGDRLVKYGDTPLAATADLVAQLADDAPGDRVKLEFERAGKPAAVEVELADAGEQTSGVSIRIPAALPPAHETLPPADEKHPKTKQPLGVVPLKLPEFKNAATAYIPERFEGRTPLGLLICLVTQSAPKDADEIARWQTLCDQHEFMLLVVRSTDAAAWQPGEAEFIHRALEMVALRYPLDRARLALLGADASGTTALALALTQRQAIRAVVAIEAALPVGVEIPEAEPLAPLSVFLARSERSRQLRRIDAAAAELRKQHHAVVTKSLPAGRRDLDTTDRAEIARWLDALDLM
jgi:serine protease Do